MATITAPHERLAEVPTIDLRRELCVRFAEERRQFLEKLGRCAICDGKIDFPVYSIGRGEVRVTGCENGHQVVTVPSGFQVRWYDS